MVSRWSVLVSCMLLTSGALAAKPPSIEKQYKAAVKLEVSGDIAGALAAFEAIPEGKRDYRVRVVGQFATAEDVLETVIAWGRHGEVFEYDYNAGTIHLPTGEEDDTAPPPTHP